MYKLNISFAVSPPAHEWWLDFIRTKVMPSLRERGYDSMTLSRVLSAQSEDHFTYSLLVDLDSMEAYSRFTNEAWSEYAEVAGQLFGEDVLWFTSVLKEIE